MASANTSAIEEIFRLARRADHRSLRSHLHEDATWQCLFAHMRRHPGNDTSQRRPDHVLVRFEQKALVRTRIGQTELELNRRVIEPSDRGPRRRKPLGHPQLIRADAHDRGDHERHEDADASHVLSPFRRCRRVEVSLEVMNWV